MRVLFLAYTCDKFHTEICQLVKRKLETLCPKAVCKILELEEKRMSYFESIFDKRTINFATKVIEKVRPHVIVVTNDTGPAATFIKLGRIKKIPTLAIQDGYLARRVQKTPTDFLRWKKYLLWRLLSSISCIPIVEKLAIFLGWRTRVLDWGFGGVDVYAVIGNRSKQVLVSCGVSPQRIVITGYPLFDKTYQLPSFEKEKVKQQFGLYDGCVVLLVTQPLVEDGLWKPYMHEKLVKSVIQATEQLNLQFVIKLHPREVMEKYEAIIKGKENKKVIIVKNVDLHKLLQISDVVIVISSTVGLWALVYNKPLITITCFSMGHYNMYESEDMAIAVKNLENLPEVLGSIIENKKGRSKSLRITKERLYDHLYRLDGKASERIAKLITNLIDRRERCQKKC